MIPTLPSSLPSPLLLPNQNFSTRKENLRSKRSTQSRNRQIRRRLTRQCWQLLRRWKTWVSIWRVAGVWAKDSILIRWRSNFLNAMLFLHEMRVMSSDWITMANSNTGVPFGISTHTLMASALTSHIPLFSHVVSTYHWSTAHTTSNTRKASEQ